MIRKWMALAVVATGCLLGQISIATADEVPGCCAESGCTKTVCRPVVENKVVTTRVFTDVKEEFCLTCSPLSLLFPSKCGCSHVKCRKILVVKVRKHDECVKKCIPVQVPKCTTCAPACSAPCATGSCAAAPCAPDHQPAAPAVIMMPAVTTVPAVTTMPAGPIPMPVGK